MLLLLLRSSPPAQPARRSSVTVRAAGWDVSAEVPAHLKGKDLAGSECGTPWLARCHCASVWQAGAAPPQQPASKAVPPRGSSALYSRAAFPHALPTRPLCPPPHPTPIDFGFDPLGLGKNEQALKWYQQAELQHARWSMLGVAGILVQVGAAGSWCWG